MENNTKTIKIFFSGIGGSGVSALAGFMAARGHDVWGSDRAFDRDPNHPLLKPLSENNIKIVPQDGTHIDSSFDFAVFSTAVESSNVEYRRAAELKIPMKTRPEFLIELSRNFTTVAVAGTSGKSTTSGMIAFILESLHHSPNFIGGGRVRNFKERNLLGNYLTGKSNLLIIEACESDGSLIHYEPEYLLLLNLELDHHSIEVTAELFKKVSNNTKTLVIINGDDKNLRKLPIKNPLTFSLKHESTFKPDKIKLYPFASEFTLKGEKFKLPLSGLHNLYNALAALALVSALGISLKSVSEVLAEFKGIDRRFNIVFNNGEKLVIDDYAHNPHKIKSLIETVKRFRDGVCFIFQPHGYGPTKLMKEEYIRLFTECLSREDHLILLPIYYSGGTVQMDISSHDLARDIKAKGKSVEVLEKREDLFCRLDRWHTFVVFGARDESLSAYAEEIARRLP